MSRATTLMFQGTGSDVGKSLIVAGLCRYFTLQGLSVAPFKPQNMSNNAAVTCEGGEIGRAQAFQAYACRKQPSLDMNPILLKPQSDVGSQLIVQGKRLQNITARQYHRERGKFMPTVLDSFHRLTATHDLVLVEGAGSPAEINLRQGDIANMGFALASQTPVVLIGDIERGGVIASLAGTYHLLSSQEQALIRGSIINKFRGDISLFKTGCDLVAQHTSNPCLGVIPYFDGAKTLPDEDSMALSNHLKHRPISSHLSNKDASVLKICVLHFPHIANFDDLDPLKLDPNVNLIMLPVGTPIPGDCDLVILPGTKTTITDLDVVRHCGWDIDLLAHYRRRGWILGLCGGYQMLGTEITDPYQIEGSISVCQGLGLLDFKTEMTADKTLSVQTVTEKATSLQTSGYEMHIGITHGPDCDAAWFCHHDGRLEGVALPEKRLFGTYMHGLFKSDAFRHHFLMQISGQSSALASVDYQQTIDKVLDQFADHLADYLDMATLRRCFSR